MGFRERDRADHRFAASCQSRRPEDEHVHRDPDEAHEIPVDAVVIYIAEMLAFDRAEPEQRSEYPRFQCLEEKKRAVKRDSDPRGRSVCVGIPVHVEIAKHEDAERYRDGSKDRHDEQPHLYAPFVEPAGFLVQPVIGNVRERQKQCAKRRTNEVGYTLWRRRPVVKILSHVEIRHRADHESRRFDRDECSCPPPRGCTPAEDNRRRLRNVDDFLVGLHLPASASGSDSPASLRSCSDFSGHPHITHVGNRRMRPMTSPQTVKIAVMNVTPVARAAMNGQMLGSGES